MKDREDILEDLQTYVDLIDTAISNIEEISDKYHEDYKFDAIKSIQLFRDKLMHNITGLEDEIRQEFEKEWH